MEEIFNRLTVLALQALLSKVAPTSSRLNLIADHSWRCQSVTGGFGPVELVGFGALIS